MELKDRLLSLGKQLDDCLLEIEKAKKISVERSGIIKLAMANLRVSKHAETS